MPLNKRISFKKAAEQILKTANEPLSAQEIAEQALQQGILSSEGKTPEATMAAQLYVDIKDNKKTKFKKVGKGKFTLKEQTASSTSPLLLVENQNDLVKKALMKKLYDMDPYQFELLIADLLKEIGYENVETTKKSGDKGIDVIANLTMDGITNVKTVIQAKRFKAGNNISGKIITQLRGSAEVDQRGLVITTSDFTKDALQESRAPKKMPVSLVNGEKLLKLLIKHGVGVKKDNVVLFSVDNEYFENEDDIGKKIKISGKYRSIWPLPGGTNSYIKTLFMYLEAILQGINTPQKLTEWYIARFETVKSEKTANGYIKVPNNMGLTYMNSGYVQLTDAGRKVIKEKSIDLLYEIISKNILAFDDIVEFIRTSGEIQTESSVLEFLKENFDIEWSTFAQVNFRLIWLMNLGKIKKVHEGYSVVE